MKWISVEEESLPKEEQILAFIKDEYEHRRILTIIWCDDIENWIPNCGCDGWEHRWPKFKIIYWMRLPPLPKEKDDLCLV